MLAVAWKNAFLETLTRHEHAAALREAMTLGRRDWTEAITRVAVAACGALGWQATARGHRAASLPVARGEYLSIDLTAFAPGPERWRFPTAIMELENQPSTDYIAYNLWKLLCVRADLRALFCYREEAAAGPPLVNDLTREVVRPLLTDRGLTVPGETLVVIGNRAESAAFPYAYFKWWQLEQGVGRFGLY